MASGPLHTDRGHREVLFGDRGEATGSVSPVTNIPAALDRLCYRYPSILVELGNMKNPVDSALMESAEGRQKYADALTRGVAGFLASQGQVR